MLIKVLWRSPYIPLNLMKTACALLATLYIDTCLSKTKTCNSLGMLVLLLFNLNFVNMFASLILFTLSVFIEHVLLISHAKGISG